MPSAQIFAIPTKLPNHQLEREPTLVPINSPYELCVYMREAIRDSRMKYKVIASRANCHPLTVSRLADGTTRDPHSSTCVKILFAMGKNVYIGG